MQREISLSDLKDLDDHGSFDRMMQDALEAADGDESKVWDFLTGSVLKSFIEKHAAGDDHGHDDYHDDLPPELRNHIESTFNGTDILLVMEKTITASDIDRNQNRLLFGVNNVKNQFLITQEEKNKVNQPGGLQVSVIQPCFETTSEVDLRKRTKKDSRYSGYVLTGNWFKIAENEMNHLRINDTKLGSAICRRGHDLASFILPKFSNGPIGVGVVVVLLL
ncbi:hypothetical protein Dsin_003933 [Dipteronia sinensis]|uniref:Uncharacterized protein n=1 Tax=Dipteronia sinensis TaxID=43782 RepID=A0AAE0B907_9ROSI|nr:hypothetical protein Dsin_003933 [Dipteronia sinensis]